MFGFVITIMYCAVDVQRSGCGGGRSADCNEGSRETEGT